MDNGDLRIALEGFADDYNFRGKGPLCVALVVTQHAKTQGLPLEPTTLVTKGGGQVLGLGKSAVQAVLRRHGIKRVLAAEGGRTSRGSLLRMRDYVTFLNQLGEDSDLEAVEHFWVEKVRSFFAANPFRIRLDASRGLRSLVRDVIRQAVARQEEGIGTQYAGAVLQHLTGTKLDCALGQGKCEHNSFSTADAASGRAGDFIVGNVAIHVTMSPSEAVIHRCRDNLDAGYRPVLVTTRRGLSVAEGLAENAGIEARIDMFEIEQFVALNLYEIAGFKEGVSRERVLAEFVSRYNEIIEDHETDPSLKIEIRN